MKQPVTKAQAEILVAMASRAAPLIRGPTGWFVRGWGGDVTRRDARALLSTELVGSAGGAHAHVYVLTEAGRNVALNASDKKALAA